MTTTPLQGQEATRLPRWINLRQLGREFNLTGPAMGKHLDALGLRADKRPTAKAERMGVGRLLPSSAHLEHPVVQWHSAKAIAALKDSGLVPVEAFVVFCRGGADKIHTHLLRIGMAGDPGPAEQWWITKQLAQHLKQVPGNQRQEFIDALVDDIAARKRKVPVEIVHSLLGAAGELDGHLARMMAQRIAQATPQVRSSAGSWRRL